MNSVDDVEIDHEVEEEFKRLTETTSKLEQITHQTPKMLQDRNPLSNEIRNAHMRHQSQDLVSAEDMMVISEATKDIDMSSRHPSILPPKQSFGTNAILRAEKRYGSMNVPIITAKPPAAIISEIANDDYISSFEQTRAKTRQHKPANVGIL